MRGIYNFPHLEYTYLGILKILTLWNGHPNTNRHRHRARVRILCGKPQAHPNTNRHRGGPTPTYIVCRDYLDASASSSSLVTTFRRQGTSPVVQPPLSRRLPPSILAVVHMAPAVNRKKTALGTFGRDMTAVANTRDPVICRDDEIDRVVCILCRRTKNNAVLVGAPGVGKTAIAEGLAQRIAAGAVPATLIGKHVMELDLGALLAGTTLQGMFEERMKKVIQEAEDADGKVILFIDEMHMLIGAGGDVNAADLLKPALARGRIQCVGATTSDEYSKFIEKDAALERRFQKVQVEEPTTDATVDILLGLKQRYEAHHGLIILNSTIVAAVRLAARYITGTMKNTLTYFGFVFS